MMPRLLTLFLVHSAMVAVLWAQPLYRDPLFAISPNDVRCLQYATIRNVFDSAYVQFTVGELRLRAGNTCRSIPLALDQFEPNLQVQGDGSQGRDHLLASKLVSTSFELPLHDATLEFFRMIRVQRGCIERGSADQPQSGDNPSSPVDWNFCPGVAALTDTTSLAIELVRESDGLVLVTLDSVCVRSIDHSRFASLSGTNPATMNRSVVLPSSVLGERVYVRLVPYRNGVTPYGCAAYREDAWISKSAHNSYEPGLMPLMPQNDHRWARIDSLYWEQLLSFFDGVLAQYGCVQTTMIPRYFPPGTYQQEFMQRYFDVLNDVASDSMVVPFSTRPCNEQASVQSTSSRIPAPRLAVISAAWSSDADITLAVRCNQRISQATVDVIAVATGQRIGTWIVDVQPGRTDVYINVPAAPSGAYLAVLRDGSQAISSTNVILTR